MSEGKKWFIVRVRSAQEYKVAQKLAEKFKEYFGPEIQIEKLRDAPPSFHFVFKRNSDELAQILIPTRKSLKKRKKVKKDEGEEEVEKEKYEKLYPGYVVIEVEPSQELFNSIARIPGIVRFGAKGKLPCPMSEEEVRNMFGYTKPEGVKITQMPFTKGMRVKVIDGPFVDFEGTIEEINEKKHRIKIIISVLGRETPLDLSFREVEPV